MSAHELDAPAAAAYKSLSHVERAFRSIKTVDMQVRLVFHYSWLARAHVFLCMLAYYVEWAHAPALEAHAVRRRGPGQSQRQPRSPVLWRFVQHMPRPRMPARPLTTACRCTASERCCRTWARWPTTSHTYAG
ncbi:MAG: hypothetical protein IPL57_20410 [Rubrivivax sp.]|nr:hypothetical protein [Rubrivivax sp.]